jgi:uncharacterized protein (DUF302 family)
MMQLAYQTKLDVPYDEAIEKVTAALKAEGFGVLTEIDVKATLKKKLGADFRKYVILGACNPPIAHEALTASLDVGIFLPCNTVVYEDDDGGSVVAIMNPGAALEMLPDVDLPSTAAEATARIKRVIASLES